MIRHHRLQVLAVLAVGAVGGWLAASGRLPLQSRSDVAQPTQAPSPTPGAACCVGTERGVLLAQASPPTTALPILASQRAADAGRKPNIVFIMGDDIGVWNIGAYHRGMSAGKTPNLDRLASQGMLFTDYY